MYLEENLERLNDKYNPLGLHFEYDGNIIRVIEDTKYLLNNYPVIKQELKINYKSTVITVKTLINLSNKLLGLI